MNRTMIKPGLSSRLYETIAIGTLAIALGLLVWSLLSVRWVVAWLLEIGLDNSILIIVCALLVHVACWAMLMLPLRLISDKAELSDEMRALPNAIEAASNEQLQQLQQHTRASNSPARRRHFRTLGLAGIGTGATLLLAALAAGTASGWTFLLLGGIGLGLLLTALWFLITGRPASSG